MARQAAMAFGFSSKKGRNYFGLVLAVLLIVGAVSFLVLYSGIPLCFACPTSVTYNSSGSTHTLKSIGTNGIVSTQTLTGGTQTWPVGSAYQQFSISGPSGSFGTWVTTLPADQSTGSSTSYVFTSSYSGTAFLTSANNAQLWTSESGSLNNNNPVVFNSTYTSSIPGAACNTASTTNVCKVSWYLNRYYFTVDMKTAGAGLYIACAPQASCQGYSSFLGLLSNKAQYDAAFQQGFTSVLSAVNSVAHLGPGTSLSLQLNLPPLPSGQSNVDYAGIAAAWTATPCTGGSATPTGGGTGSNDLCVTSCGAPAGCSIVQSAVHTPLPLFRDSGLSQPYLPNFAPYYGVQGYNAQQLSTLLSSSLMGQVYTKIDISDFGAGFSQGSNYSNCGISNFGACWTVSQPEAVLTVLLDVITSNHIYQQYATPPPQTGTSAGSVDGQVVDGSLPWRPGVAGAMICLTDITGCVAADANGNFVLTNVAAGQHTIQITAPLFFATGQLTVSVSTGSTFHLGQVALAPQNPWYLGCWQVVAPAYPGAFQVCIPWVIVFSAIGGLILLGSIAIYVNSVGGKVNAGSRIVRRLVPTNPLSPKAQGFVARNIAIEINAGKPAKEAQAIAFSKARAAGYHVPPPPKR